MLNTTVAILTTLDRERKIKKEEKMLQKQPQFTVTLTFTEPVTQHQQREVMLKMLSALNNEVHSGEGLAPDLHDAEDGCITTSIRVSNGTDTVYQNISTDYEPVIKSFGTSGLTQ